MITCNKCNVSRAEEEFRRNSKTTTGRETTCKQCRKGQEKTRVRKPVVTKLPSQGEVTAGKSVSWTDIANTPRRLKCWFCNANENCKCKDTREKAAGFFKELSCWKCGENYELHEGPAGAVYCDVCLHKITPALEAWTNLVKCVGCSKRRPVCAYLDGDEVCEVCHGFEKRGIWTPRTKKRVIVGVEGPTGPAGPTGIQDVFDKY